MGRTYGRTERTKLPIQNPYHPPPPPRVLVKDEIINLVIPMDQPPHSLFLLLGAELFGSSLEVRDHRGFALDLARRALVVGLAVQVDTQVRGDLGSPLSLTDA